ncbi:hypothetical protein HDE_06077 [Halotydeus destructor]|nr:hypothetical protein HDE_06077 [Halotydeus destructor]
MRSTVVQILLLMVVSMVMAYDSVDDMDTADSVMRPGWRRPWEMNDVRGWSPSGAPLKMADLTTPSSVAKWIRPWEEKTTPPTTTEKPRAVNGWIKPWEQPKKSDPWADVVMKKDGETPLMVIQPNDPSWSRKKIYLILKVQSDDSDWKMKAKMWSGGI